MSSSLPTRRHASGSGDQVPAVRRRSAVRDACVYCFQRHNLRRTVQIAIVVGVILTAINQGSVITAGHATVATWVRCALNFIVPFLVSNAGLLSARR